MSTKIERYIDDKIANGDISFTTDDVCRSLPLTKNAALSAISRLKQASKIVSPCKGYYLIVTPEFRIRGCPPADFFIDDLMRHLGREYYVCLLSAAMFYGAAHQQPQMMQVMLNAVQRNIQCGSTAIEFIKNADLADTPIQKIKTRTGYMNVSTPEATARDMLRYMPQCGGINRIATVLEELAGSIYADPLKKMAQADHGAIWIRRLGYLLDCVDAETLSSALYEHVNQQADFVPLVPYASMTGAKRNKKWRLAINATIESDLDDPD